jgi:hypothetical protein
MTTPSTEPGEIYFIGERDMRSGERSPYVKIGLVGSTRTSADRLYDHRTANPRELIVHGEVRTDLVAWVENALHRKFAKYRIQGEWFVLDDELIAAAILEAQRLASTLAPLVSIIARAKELRGVESDGSAIPATAEVLEWLAKVRLAKALVKECGDLDSVYAGVVSDLSRSGDAGPTIGGIKVIESTVFDEDKFKESHPALWAEFTTVADKGISGRFTITSGDALKISDVAPELATFSAVFRSDCAGAMQARKVDDHLKSRFLELKWREKAAQLDLMTADSHLQAACGTADEITGVCKWKRVRKFVKEFDEDRFAAANPQMYKEFCVTKLSERVTKSTKGKS